MILRALFFAALGLVAGISLGAFRHSADQVQLERCVDDLGQAIDAIDRLMPPAPQPLILVPALEDEQEGDIV